MAEIHGKDRKQHWMLPPTLDEWIPEDHPARVVDMFVESLEITIDGAEENAKRTGRPNYPARVMLKILLYGYATGERSSRVIERKTYDDIGYRWLSQDLHPDYRSIARFRQYNGYCIRELLKDTLLMYEDIGCKISGVVFTDGTKIYANASDNKVASEKRIKQLEEQAKKILEEAEKADKEEDKDQGDNNDNFVKKERLEKIKEKIEKMKAAKKESNKKTVSMTDKDASFMRHSMGKGLHLSYNAQITADRSGIILAADVTEKAADDGELLRENLEQAKKNSGKKVTKIVADAGYYETESIKTISKEGCQCLVPKPENVAKGDTKFQYDDQKNTYQCEKGKTLSRLHTKVARGNKYTVYAARIEDCRKCGLCGKCYKGKGKGKYGRRIMIYEDWKFVEEYLRILKKNKALYDKRKTTIEPLIGTIKERQRFRGFLLRGIEKVKTEWSLIATGSNLMKIWRIMLAKN